MLYTKLSSEQLQDKQIRKKKKQQKPKHLTFDQAMGVVDLRSFSLDREASGTRLKPPITFFK